MPQNKPLTLRLLPLTRKLQKMKNIKTTLALLFLTGSLFAQGHTEEVTVVAPHQPILIGEFTKINISPQTIDSVLVPRPISYSIFSRKVPTVFPLDNIRPARVAGEPLSRLTPLYVRGGFGNYNTWYGELFYGSGRSRNWEYGTHLKHRSSRGQFSGHYVPFDNSENLVRLFGNHFGRNVVLSADFYYDRRRFSAYGADSIFMQFVPGFFDENFYRRVFNKVGGSFGFSDNQTEVIGFRYSGRFDIGGITSNHGGEDTVNPRELSFGFSGNINQTFAMFRPNLDRITIGLDASVEGNRFQWDMDFSTPLHTTMIQFRPYGKFYIGDHELSLGLRANIFNRTWINDTDTRLQVFPTVHARINLLDNILSVNLGMDGNAKHATYRRMVERNPFIAPSLWPGIEVETHREYYLGFITTLSKRMDFSMQGSFLSYRNMLNFDSEMMDWWRRSPIIIYRPPWLLPITSPFFRPTFQDVNIVRLQANLNYQLDERISVSAMARWNSYDRSDILYMPTFEASLTARYNIQDKIIFTTQLFVDAGRYARTNMFGIGNFERERLRPIVDWSMSAEYRFNRRWGAFLEVNNILNQRRYNWFNYRTFGTNFLLGATFNL